MDVVWHCSAAEALSISFVSAVPISNELKIAVMMFELDTLAPLLGLSACVQALYMARTFGAAHYVYALRLAGLGTISLFLSLVGTVLSGQHTFLVHLPGIPALRAALPTLLRLPPDVIFNISRAGLIAALALLLCFFIAPVVLRGWSAHAFQMGNRLAGARLLRLQAQIYGGGLAQGYRVIAMLQVLAAQDGLLAARRAAAERFIGLAHGEREADSSDNFVSTLLADTGDWQILASLRTEQGSGQGSFTLGPGKIRGLSTMLLHVARAKIEVGDLGGAAQIIHALARTRAAIYWTGALEWLATYAASRVASYPAELQAQHSLEADAQLTKATSEYIFPSETPRWLKQLLCVEVAVWLICQILPSSSTDMLLETFANKPFAAWHGFEGWRLLTHIGLHLNFFHLALNCLVLFVFGRSISRLIGPRRSVLLVCIGALTGGIASSLQNTYVYGIGASTAAMAVYAFWLLSFLRFSRHYARHWLGYVVSSGVCIMVIQLVADYVSPMIDGWAHVGGFLGGILAYLLLTPRRVPTVQIAGSLGLLLSVQLASCIPVHAEVAIDVRELWVGQFTQSGSPSWTGPMQLYIRYDASASPPQRLTGMIIWKTLGGSKVQIEGTRSDDSIRFKETNCISGNCDQLIVGGEYSARYDIGHSTLHGTARHEKHSLSGAFSLHRLVAEE